MKQVRSGMQVSAILAAALFLSACGGSGAGGSADPSAAPAAGNPPSGGEQLTMLIPDRLLSVGAGTSEGYYYVEPGLSDALTGQIRYVDYATCMDIPLSTQVNSDHSDETDTAYLDSIVGDYRMFVYADHLYFIRSGSVENSDLGALAAGAVYRMNLDGSAQTQIYTCDDGSTLLMYAVGGQECLYLLQQESDGTKVLRIPEDGGEAAVVANLPANDYYNLIGCRDGLLYLHQIGIDPNRENSEGDMGATTHTLATLDVQSGTLSELADLCPSNGRYAEPHMAGGTLLYYYPDGERQVAICDENGQVQTTISLTEVAGNSFQQVDTPYLVGNTLFIPCWDAEQDHGYQILVDTGTGAVSRSDVCLTQEDGKDPLGATVLAENDTAYLVMTEIRHEDAELHKGDGTAVTLQNQVYGYSLIPKQQFAAQDPELQPIQRVQ